MLGDKKYLDKPVFKGPPLSDADGYYRRRLAEYRKEHEKFEAFLQKLKRCAKEKGYACFDNIVKFIDGKAKANWIAPDNSMFGGLINLYNYLEDDPSLDIGFIDDFYSSYQRMLATDYALCGDVKLTIGKSDWNGEPGKFINFSVRPVYVPEDDLNYFGFDIKTSLTMIDDDINDVDCYVEKMMLWPMYSLEQDDLKLFEIGQGDKLRRRIFKSAIKALEKEGVIKEVGHESYCGLTIRYYDSDLPLSEPDPRDTGLEDEE